MSPRRWWTLPVAAAVALGCASPPPAWHEEAGHRWRSLEVKGGEPGFTRMADRRTGIRFENQVSDSLLVGNRILGQGAGVAIGDVDGDGLPDVFLARTEGTNALYRNRGNWRFEDISAASGIAAAERRSSGATFADLDGDGDLDLVLLATTGPNATYLNDGSGRFTEQPLGLEATGRGATTPALADVDGDGDLDLYIANYKPYSPADSIPPQQMAMNQVVGQTGPDTYAVRPEYARDFKLVMREDLGGMQLTMRAEANEFYLNEGGRFRQVPIASAMFRDRMGQPLAEAAESFSLGARFADLNGDGAPDLYVVNDFEDPDEFWLNDGQGGFQVADWTAQRQMSNSGMAVDVGDVNADGLPDFFEVDMLGNDYRRRKTQMPTHAAAPKRPGDLASQVQLQRNTMFVNRGDGTFIEVSEFAGVQASGWSWSTILMDVDLDGWQDILVGTGHLWDVMDADTQERLTNRLTGVAWQRSRWEFPPLRLKNVAYRNRGDLTWEDVSEAWGFGTEEDISHTMAAGDLDGDGDADIVVNRLRDPALVLRNNAAAPRIAVRLVGDAPNTKAVGARIRVLGGAVPVQEREVTAGGLYMSHSDYQAGFATGSAERVTIQVTWRDGRVTTLTDAVPGRLYEITAATASAAPAPSEPAPVNALFEDASAMLGGHRHVESTFDDWAHQFLLPNALSQLGPGLAWFDTDQDGDEDLIVGAGGGGQVAIFRNQSGRLVPAPAGPTAPADLTTVLGLTVDGSPQLLLGASSWERREGDAAMLPAVMSVGLRGGPPRAVPAVGPRNAATGPLALADYDGDGDLDLFVGGRMVPGSYPVAAPSALYRNDGGRFVEDTAQSATKQPLGLVSSAVFADVDADGDPDLIVAREWGSLLLLQNTGGRFEDVSVAWGLSTLTSRWNGIATGDLDGDGRLDLVATSWGRNVVTPADSVRPLELFYGGFGAQGEIEMLLARADPERPGLAPLNSYPRLRVAIPGLSTRIRSFGEYAEATVQDVLGEFYPSAARLEVITQDQMLFLNRGGQFEPQALPREAQLAPAQAPVIADFTGDGREDLFLSQNFFPTALGIPRYDTGRGLLLVADSTGALVPMAGRSAGILLYGDQRGAAAADFNGDGRLDLAVAQNASTTALLRNRGAHPGLRVRLQGPPDNPDGIGAQVRLEFASGAGPVREVQAGSGYWSQHGAVQVFGMPSMPTSVWVRWPGGRETRAPVPAGAREVVVRP